MQPDSRFLDLTPVFWANVKTISEALGYANRRARDGSGGDIKVHRMREIRQAYRTLDLDATHLFSSDGQPTEMGATLLAYFEHRADTLNTIAEPNLMDGPDAIIEYQRLLPATPANHKVTLNKQKGDKAGPAMLTEMVNIILGNKLGSFDPNPQQLTTVTRDNLPVRTLSRRVDGAYPAAVNPVAIWEIKEYYFTTSFGSRVADGVYETMLDGIELKELRDDTGIDVKHYLIVDGKYTWWGMGRSYLCRMVDLLHQGLVDEVLFGREVVTRLPRIADELLQLHPHETNQVPVFELEDPR